MKRLKRSARADPIHDRVRKQAAQAWAHLAETGVPAPRSSAPAVVELYEAARNAAQRHRGRSLLRNFVWRGQSYPLQFTNFGRIKVLDPTNPDPSRALVVGPIFDLW